MNRRKRSTGKGTLAAAVIVAIGWGLQQLGIVDLSSGSSSSAAPGNATILKAFADRRSDVMVEGSGAVISVLPDDLEGSKHQRFILELQDGATVLIAHNIDLAPRVPLTLGDRIEFKGEYEWNDKGGVVHWTHHDPAGRHEGGWLRRGGQTYE